MKDGGSEQAIPAWMKVKDMMVETWFSTKRSMRKFRHSTNPAHFSEFQNQVVVMYDLIREHYLFDKKLIKRFPQLKEMDKQIMGIKKGHTPDWWMKRYWEIGECLFAMNIIKLTQYTGDDDDFAGTIDVPEVDDD